MFTIGLIVTGYVHYHKTIEHFVLGQAIEFGNALFWDIFVRGVIIGFECMSTTFGGGLIFVFTSQIYRRYFERGLPTHREYRNSTPKQFKEEFNFVNFCCNVVF